MHGLKSGVVPGVLCMRSYASGHVQAGQKENHACDVVAGPERKQTSRWKVGLVRWGARNRLLRRDWARFKACEGPSKKAVMGPKVWVNGPIKNKTKKDKID